MYFNRLRHTPTIKYNGIVFYIAEPVIYAFRIDRELPFILVNTETNLYMRRSEVPDLYNAILAWYNNCIDMDLGSYLNKLGFKLQRDSLITKLFKLFCDRFGHDFCHGEIQVCCRCRHIRIFRNEYW